MLTKACRECLGCMRMELAGWVEPEFCPSSPDPERRHPPKQMKMEECHGHGEQRNDIERHG